MTEEERAVLDRVAKQSDMVHRALFEVAPGTNQAPLINDLNRLAQAYNKASWVTRGVFWLVPALAALALGIEKLIGFWK